MEYLVSHYIGWIASALALGLCAGWIIGARPQTTISRGLLFSALAPFVAALWTAFAGLLPGRLGHGLEVFLMLLIPWLFGWGIGAPLRRAFPPAARNVGSSAPASTAAPVALAENVAASLAAVTSAPAMQAARAQLRPAAPAAGVAPLTAIANIGVATEERLRSLGVTSVCAISEWEAGDASFIGERVGDPGVVEREMWIAQARLLSAGVETSYSAMRRMARAGGAAGAPLDAARLADFRHELEDLAESAGLNAFSFAPPRAAEAMRLDDAPSGRVSDEHKPMLHAAPPSQGADNLKLISGVGPKLEAMLNEMGVYRFDQIAAWSETNLRWIDQNLQAYCGRAARDRWIEQAGKLAGGRRESEASEKSRT